MPESRITLAGSERTPIPGSQPLTEPEATPDPNQYLIITVLIRRKQALPNSVVRAGNLTREQLAADYGASTIDLQAVRRLAADYNLKVVDESALKRTMELSGTIQDLERAFGTQLLNVQVDNAVYRERTGPLTLPQDVAPIIEGVFGLDNRQVARPHLRFHPAAAPEQGFSPLDVAQLYNFPPGTGAGQTISIIELGGGFAQADLNTYFAGLGLTPPVVTAVPVLGGSNTPVGDPDSADGEVMLDIEVVGAIAPQAQIKVYFAPNTDQGFLAAVNAAVHDTPTPTAISISWGGPENSWTAANLNAFEQAFQNAATLSASVTVASGDHGSMDGTTALVVDFPASAPHALGCGGTNLEGDTTITSEVVWNDGTDSQGNFWATGGGVSSVFPQPSYQANIILPAAGRGVPDVSGEAASPGYKVRIDGEDTVVGGTSAVAPLWAGLIARLAEITGQRVPFLAPILYANPQAFQDITQGDNDSTGGNQYQAGPGWDPCTGLGTPNGAAVLAALQTAVPQPTQNPPPTSGSNGTGCNGTGSTGGAGAASHPGRDPLIGHQTEVPSPLPPTPAAPPVPARTNRAVVGGMVAMVAIVGIVAIVALSKKRS
jgi:kumamolisin